MKKNTKKNKRTYVGLGLRRINAHAFSNLEVILVIALITIIGLTSVPFLSRFLVQSATIDTYNNLLAQLRKAQSYAMTGKQNGSWGVYYGTVAGTKKIILYQGNTYASHVNTTFDESYSVSPNVTITGLTDINFSKVSGTPNTTANITITGTSNTTRNIQINAQGIVNYAIAGPTYTPAPTPMYTPTPTLGPPETITLDSDTATAKNSSATSWSQTVANHPDRIIIVGIGSGSNPTGVTYAGAPLTEITYYCGGDCTSLWYNVNPPTGTNTVAVSGTAMTGGGSSIYYGVSQSNPIGNYQTGTSTTSSVSVSVNGTNNKQVVVDNAWLTQLATLTPGSGQTATWTTGSNFTNVDGSRKTGGSSSTTMSWSGGSGSWYEAAVAINPGP
jgi:Tfp pilus assembly protein FimT